MTSAPFQRAVVVGLGKSGRSACELLLSRGVKVTAFDEKSGDAGLEARGVSVKVGPLPKRFWDGADVVVLSPGVPRSKSEIRAALDAQAPVIGEIELAYRLLPEGAGPLLGVTGTNGKSTTTALLGQLMRETGKKVFTGGNLGTPFSDACAQPHDWHVVELSSFQLESVVDARFLGGAILNLTPDHLDRYPDHHAYGDAKANLFRRLDPNGFAVVNADDPHVLGLGAHAKTRLFGFTTQLTGTNAGFTGVAIGEGQSCMFLFGDRPRFEVRSRALRGAHNVQNAMAAALLASLAGVPGDAIQRGLDAFPGLPHRLESVRELHGVEWINDSKATNVDSTLVALHALTAPLWLIAGGKGKGAPYAPLVEAAKGRVKGVLTIGQDAPAIAQAFQGFTVVDCQTLERAVAEGHRRATRGDAVLLSPACASYDQFQHFEHRGDTFKQLVKALS